MHDILDENIKIRLIYFPAAVTRRYKVEPMSSKNPTSKQKFSKQRNGSIIKRTVTQIPGLPSFFACIISPIASVMLPLISGYLQPFGNASTVRHFRDNCHSNGRTGYFSIAIPLLYPDLTFDNLQLFKSISSICMLNFFYSFIICEGDDIC
jgi:hypothetical protein